MQQTYIRGHVEPHISQQPQHLICIYDSSLTTVLPAQLHSTHLNETKAPLAHGLHSISLANAEWQAQDRHKQQPLRELDPMVGFLQLAEKYTN